LGLIVALCVDAGLEPTHAQLVTQAFVASTGDDTHTCAEIQPCRTFGRALAQVQARGEITVLDTAMYGPVNINKSVSIVATGQASIVDQSFCVTNAPPCSTINIIAGATDVVTLRGLVLDGSVDSNTSGVLIFNAARVNIENCVIYNSSNPGIYVAPGTAGQPVTLASTIDIKVQDTTVSRGGAGINITSVPGVQVNAAITRSQIDNNTGGGVRVDASAGGAITATISDSHISLNGGNGLNAVGSSSNVMVNLLRDVIASNGVAGVQANGASAAVLVNSTALLNNTSALSAVNGGRILTYGNNSIVGTPGTGFTGTASLQ
jgi:hypothetical protein